MELPASQFKRGDTFQREGMKGLILSEAGIQAGSPYYWVYLESGQVSKISEYGLTADSAWTSSAHKYAVGTKVTTDAGLGIIVKYETLANGHPIYYISLDSSPYRNFVMVMEERIMTAGIQLWGGGMATVSIKTAGLLSVLEPGETVKDRVEKCIEARNWYAASAWIDQGGLDSLFYAEKLLARLEQEGDDPEFAYEIAYWRKMLGKETDAPKKQKTGVMWGLPQEMYKSPPEEQLAWLIDNRGLQVAALCAAEWGIDTSFMDDYKWHYRDDKTLQEPERVGKTPSATDFLRIWRDGIPSKNKGTQQAPAPAPASGRPPTLPEWSQTDYSSLQTRKISWEFLATSSLTRNAGVWDKVVEYIKSNFGGIDDAFEQLAAAQEAVASGELEPAQSGLFDKAKVWALFALLSAATGTNAWSGDLAALRSQVESAIGSGQTMAVDEELGKTKETLRKRFQQKGVDVTEEQLDNAVHQITEGTYGDIIKEHQPAAPKPAPKTNYTEYSKPLTQLDLEKQHMQKLRDTQKRVGDTLRVSWNASDISMKNQAVLEDIKGVLAGGPSARMVVTPNDERLIVIMRGGNNPGLVYQALSLAAEGIVAEHVGPVPTPQILVFKDKDNPQIYYGVFRIGSL